MGHRKILWLSSAACPFPVNVRAAAGVGFAYVPPYGSFNNLQGRVYGVNTASNRVAVFIYVRGAGWFAKPTCVTGRGGS